LKETGWHEQISNTDPFAGRSIGCAFCLGRPCGPCHASTSGWGSGASAGGSQNHDRQCQWKISRRQACDPLRTSIDIGSSRALHGSRPQAAERGRQAKPGKAASTREYANAASPFASGAGRVYWGQVTFAARQQNRDGTGAAGYFGPGCHSFIRPKSAAIVPLSLWG